MFAEDASVVNLMFTRARSLPSFTIWNYPFQRPFRIRATPMLTIYSNPRLSLRGNIWTGALDLYAISTQSGQNVENGFIQAVPAPKKSFPSSVKTLLPACQKWPTTLQACNVTAMCPTYMRRHQSHPSHSFMRSRVEETRANERVPSGVRKCSSIYRLSGAHIRE